MRILSYSDEVIHEGLESDTTIPNDIRQGDISGIDEALISNKGKHQVALLKSSK